MATKLPAISQVVSTHEPQAPVTSNQKTKSALLGLFPSTVEEIHRFAQSALQHFTLRLTEFPRQEFSYQATVMGWDDMLKETYNKYLILLFTNLRTQDPEVIAAAKAQAAQIKAQLEAACDDKKALSHVLCFAAQMSSLSPFQNHWTIEMLRTIGPENRDAVSLIGQLTQHATLRYTYEQGERAEKSLPEDRKIKILNWNVCFFDDLLPMLFGGVLPYQDRVDRIAQTIINSDADIVCLQEVFSIPGGIALLQKLKPHYAHFYTKMGPKVFGFDKDGHGIPSGLFGASRYPLKNAQFVSYTPEEQTPCNRAYGFFAADIYSEQEPLAHLIMTHLQPGDSQEDINYRAKQLTAVRADMERSKLHALACGDFNMEENSPEASRQLEGLVMKKAPGWTCRELRDFWFRAHQNAAQFNAYPLNVESIDYFVAHFKAAPIPSLQTEIGIVNEIDNPRDALSDHQYELTTVMFPASSQP
jgi:hypothetical protein